jgi:hypothetical protein
MKSDDRTVIETMQPYNGWHGGQLAFIADLSNTDKHRTIHLLAAMAERREVYIRNIKVENCRVVDVEVTAKNPLEDGAELARFRVLDIRPDARVYIDQEFTFDVAFADSEPTTGWDLDFISVLQDIALGAEAVLDAFAHRFQ